MKPRNSKPERLEVRESLSDWLRILLATITMLCIWIPLAIFINGAVILTIIRQIKKDIQQSYRSSIKSNIEFIVLGENIESYDTFLALTYKLSDIRGKIDTREISSDEQKKLMNELDEKLLILQESLIHINTDGIPNPDVLTKRYIQELILKVLVMRIVFEKINGRFFNDNKNFNILKLTT